MIAWVRNHVALNRRYREEKAKRIGVQLQLLGVTNDLAMWQELARCHDPREHRSLAQRLHEAQAELQVLRGEDPHTASLEHEDGGALLLVVVAAFLVVGAVLLGAQLVHRIDARPLPVEFAMADLELLPSSTTTTTTVPTTTTTTSTTVVEITTTTSAPPAPVARSWSWDYLADCESGEWGANGVPIHGTARWDDNRDGYEGGVHFAPSTWDGFRDGDMPKAAYLASREVQIVVAERVLAAQGPGAWPVCSYKVGMR